MVNTLLKICLFIFTLAAFMTSVKADVFYRTKIFGKITHVSLISDTEKLANFLADVSFSASKCRATINGEEVPCGITHYPSHEKYGLFCVAYFKITLNVHTMIKKSCFNDHRCEQLLSLTRNCNPNSFEITYRKMHIPHLNDWSEKNILQIDTPSKEEAFHVVSKVLWPTEK